MSLPVETDLPEGDEQRWWGRPLAETRWQLELARLLVDPVLRGRGVAPGDGRPVILLPGFLAGDQTLVVLAAWLRRIGYRPSTSGFIVNYDVFPLTQAGEDTLKPGKNLIAVHCHQTVGGQYVDVGFVRVKAN